MKYILGVDPGLSGALALYNPHDGELITIDMPTLAAGTGSKRVLDEVHLARTVDVWAANIHMCFLEKVHAMPKQGVTSSFNFGMGYGIVKGIIAANMVPVTLVPPRTWKSATKTPASKDAARARASQIFPRFSDQWPLKKHDGRAEAALIAYYGASQL